mmetsp:Transcript_23048/g.54407  ORF Transcript_23048/g.54407 Transcript_23048/m.54407 type:complete len:130 (+) Transcript_23048:227-616(+)
MGRSYRSELGKSVLLQSSNRGDEMGTSDCLSYNKHNPADGKNNNSCNDGRSKNKASTELSTVATGLGGSQGSQQWKGVLLQSTNSGNQVGAPIIPYFNAFRDAFHTITDRGPRQLRWFRKYKDGFHGWE